MATARNHYKMSKIAKMEQKGHFWQNWLGLIATEFTP
jgi:hypothetical protein